MVQSQPPAPRGTPAQGAPERRAIIITGASSGIGAALAQALAAPGRTLVLLGRDLSRLQAVADACHAKGAVCRTGTIDVCDRPAMADFMAAVDRELGIDLLVVSAGIMTGRPRGDAIETGDAAQRLIEVNLIAAVETLHLVLPGMLARGRGEIVIMSSLSGLAPLPDAPAYSASKAGLLFYGLALREAVAKAGIRVVVACPGYVTTPLIAGHRGARPGEVSAPEAARRIVAGLDANKGLIGFPLPLYWLSRIALLAPTFLRQPVMSLFRFHMES